MLNFVLKCDKFTLNKSTIRRSTTSQLRKRVTNSLQHAVRNGCYSTVVLLKHLQRSDCHVPRTSRAVAPNAGVGVGFVSCASRYGTFFTSTWSFCFWCVLGIMLPQRSGSKVESQDRLLSVWAQCGADRLKVLQGPIRSLPRFLSVFIKQKRKHFRNKTE